MSNSRHTELFRSCNKEADDKAKHDFRNWWKEGGVEIPAMDVIPVKDINSFMPSKKDFFFLKNTFIA